MQKERKTKMKTFLIKIAVLILTKYAADAMLTAQEVAYAKGKGSNFYKKLTKVGKRVGTVLAEVAKAGEDNVLSEEEANRCREMWQEIADDVIYVIEGHE
jgi:hypothetical protein